MLVHDFKVSLVFGDYHARVEDEHKRHAQQRMTCVNAFEVLRAAAPKGQGIAQITQR